MSADEIDDSSAPLMEHLAELRQRLIWSVGAFTVALFLCYFVSDPIFNFLTRPICRAMEARHQACGLTMIKLQEGFFVAVRIAAIGGLALSFPVISYQLWRFVAPGLYKKERAAFLPFLIASPAMFIAGGAFAYYVILPMAFSFFLSFQQPGAAPGTLTTAADANSTALAHAGITFQGSIEAYLSLTTTFIVAFGICFQLPVLLTLMGKAGIIGSQALTSVRRYAILVILIIAALVTPPDVISQLVLFAVIYALYEISIILIRRIEKNREAEERAAGNLDDDQE